MKKGLRLVFITELVQLTAFLFCGCELIRMSSPPLEERLKSTFGIDLPVDMEVKFWFHQNTGLASGKSAEYLVFKVKENPTELIDKSNFVCSYNASRDYSGRYNPFSQGRDLDFEVSFEKMIESLEPSNCYGLKHYDKCSCAKNYHLELPDEYYPDWETEYLFAGVPANYDGFYLAYFPKTLRLIILISGH